MSDAGGHAVIDAEDRPGAQKSPDAFRTISEVSVDLDVPQHVLRFWEGKFAQIKPLKRGGGRRYYRPDDVELLRGIQHLLYGDGYTIKGVQKLLREHGVKFVVAAGRREPKAKPGAPVEPTFAPASRAPESATDIYGRREPSFTPAPPPEPITVEAVEVDPAEDDTPLPVIEDTAGLGAPESEPAALPAFDRAAAAARLLSHLKSMRRDYDLKLQAAKRVSPRATFG